HISILFGAASGAPTALAELGRFGNVEILASGVYPAADPAFGFPIELGRILWIQHSGADDPDEVTLSIFFGNPYRQLLSSFGTNGRPVHTSLTGHFLEGEKGKPFDVAAISPSG